MQARQALEHRAVRLESPHARFASATQSPQSTMQDLLRDLFSRWRFSSVQVSLSARLQAAQEVRGRRPVQPQPFRARRTIARCPASCRSGRRLRSRLALLRARANLDGQANHFFLRVSKPCPAVRHHLHLLPDSDFRSVGRRDASLRSNSPLDVPCAMFHRAMLLVKVATLPQPAMCENSVRRVRPASSLPAFCLWQKNGFRRWASPEAPDPRGDRTPFSSPSIRHGPVQRGMKVRLAATAEPPKQTPPDEITSAPQEEPKPQVRTKTAEAAPAVVMNKEETKREEIGSSPLDMKTDKKSAEKEIPTPANFKPADCVGTPIPEMKHTAVSVPKPMSEEVVPRPVVETTTATSDVSEPLESSRTTERKISSLFAKKKPAETVEPAPTKAEQIVDPKPQPKRRAKATSDDDIPAARCARNRRPSRAFQLLALAA